MRRVGILGGTFDPIHYGHLRLGEEARESLRLDEVFFIPASASPFKASQRTAPAEDRYQMSLLAIQNNPSFQVSRLEIERGDVSYTIETVEGLKRLDPQAELFCLLGLDAVLDLPQWYQADQLVQLCSFAVAVRPGFDRSLVEEHLPPAYRERLYWLPMPLLDISATEIRQRLAQGRSVRYWTPDAVIDYIYAKRLY